MIRGPQRRLFLTLMLAASSPGPARALGLGEMQVDSALNEPLSAHISIIGATHDELTTLSARVANQEVFRRYGADRPGYLSSVTFKLGIDAQSRPVLNIRSSEAITDPLVDVLIDLRWPNGELVREYSLLLDPAGRSETLRLASQAAAPAVPAATPTSAIVNTDDAPATAAVGTPTLANRATRTQSGATPTGRQHRVAPRDTLQSIARHAGAHSAPQSRQMMIAIFRANPHAFLGNINRLQLGAVLEMPSAEEVAAIDPSSAAREVRAQMKAWRIEGRPAARLAAVSPQPAATATPAAHSTSAPLPKTAPSAAPPAAKAPDSSAASANASTSRPPENSAQEPQALEPRPEKNSDPASKDALNERIQNLEHSLAEMQQEMASATAVIQDLGARTAAESARRSVPVAAPATAQPSRAKFFIGAAAGAVALLLAALAYVLRRRPPAPAQKTLTPLEPSRDDAPAAVAEVAPAAPSVQAATVAPDHEPQIIAREIVPAESTTENLEVDIDALERSYLPGDLGFDTAVLPGFDTAVLPAADEPSHDDTATVETPSPRASADDATVETPTPHTASDDAATVEAPGPKNFDAIISEKMQYEIAALAGDTALDYNLFDLDAAAHVHMPDSLHHGGVMKERRKNLVDVLKAAIEKDPSRHDLRMKLLEAYFAAAATNQRAFVDLVRKLSSDQAHLSADDWKKVRHMGRQIVGNDAEFSDPSEREDVPDCA